MFDLIKTLTEICAPCGQEGPILDAMQALWSDLGMRVDRSAIGNVTAAVPGTTPAGQNKRLVLAAHGDELTFLVRDIHPDGFLMLANGQAWLRTWSLRNAFTIGQRVKVLARGGMIDGFIGAATGHIATMALPEPSELDWNEFWVDTGLTRDQLRAQGVTAGTRVVWHAATERIGNHITGKALDDRASLAVMTELARHVKGRKLAWDVTLACTVQEEIGLIGAAALAARQRFDAAIVVEIGLAGDIPSVPSHALPVRLGDGPALIHKDSGVHYDYTLTAALERSAAAAAIRIQHGVLTSFASDGSNFMKAGVPTAMMVFPARYTHTPFETAHLGDIEKMVDWLESFVSATPA